MNLHRKVKKINTGRIENAIAEFEQKVDFEFIPVITKKSSYSEHVAWMLSLLLLILFIGLVDYLFETTFHDSWMSKEPFYIATPFLAFIFGWILEKSDYVGRFFITRRERARQVHEKAELFFFRRRLHEIKSHNALLLFISVKERQIVLLPDPNMKFEGIKEINAELLKTLQVSFKDSDFEEGIVKAIELLQQRLMPHFSKKQQTDNNYPNKLIWLTD